MTDYGYGDAAPDSADKYGYGDATPQTIQDPDPYGYGDAAPDLGYGDAAPDSAAKYGYGDTTPVTSADKYGYGGGSGNRGEEQDLGYGDAAPDSEIYHTGYNDHDNNNNEAGGRGRGGRKKPQRCRSGLSEDGSVISTGSNHSVATAESYGEYDEQNPEQPRRQRYRRRGSVTKFSITAQDTVKEQYDANHNVISNYRGGGADASTGDAMQPSSAPPPPRTMSDGEDDDDNREEEDGMGDLPDTHKKKGRGKKLLKGIKQMSRRRFSTGNDF